MNQPIQPDFPILELIQNRWSPRAFEDKPIEQNTLNALFEAARWSASCFNEQPWNYFYAHRAQTEWFAHLLSALVKPNQSWAKHSAMLVAVTAKQQFALNNEENAHAVYDTGQATAQLVLQASHHGIYAHQMAGFDAQVGNQVLGLPATSQLICFMALGYLDEAKISLQDSQKAEAEPRIRKPASQFVFNQPYFEKN